MVLKVLQRSGLLESEERILEKIDAQVISAALSTEEEIIVSAQDVDAVIVGAIEPYTRKVIQSLKKCKIISRMGIGCNNIDLAAATKSGIPVAYVPDASVEEVSDHALALIMCFARKLIPINRAVKEGVWKPGRKDLLEMRKNIAPLNEQTLGLIGVGRIGSALCKKAREIGMKVIVYDPYIPLSTVQGLDAKLVEFDKVLTESDFISLHAALTKESRHLFGLKQFKKMKSTAYIINTARGGLIKEDAMFVALSKGYIAGAGLDVTDPEPPDPKNPLFHLENVILTGHTAFYSQSSARKLRERAVQAVVTALRGQVPQILANPNVVRQKNFRLRKED